VGWEVVLEARAHVLNYEDGAAAALSGIQIRAVPTADGLLTPYLPRTCAVAVENTHLEAGGRVIPLYTAAEVAHKHGVAVHLDGARLWNACAASGHAPADYACHADTVMVSFSKALGCPAPSQVSTPADSPVKRFSPSISTTRTRVLPFCEVWMV
jgi:threonine aldolase